MNRGFNKLRGRLKYNTPLCVQQLCNCTFGHANMAFWFNRPWAWSDNRSEPNRQKARTATAETTDCLESFHIIIYIYILNLKTFIDLCVLFLDISSWLVVLQLDPHPCWLHPHRCWWKPFIERINIDIFRPSPNDVAGKNHGWLIFLNQSIDLWFNRYGSHGPFRSTNGQTRLQVERPVAWSRRIFQQKTIDEPWNLVCSRHAQTNNNNNNMNYWREILTVPAENMRWNAR